MLKYAEINILYITVEHLDLDLDITIEHIRWLSHSWISIFLRVILLFSELLFVDLCWISFEADLINNVLFWWTPDMHWHQCHVRVHRLVYKAKIQMEFPHPRSKSNVNQSSKATLLKKSSCKYVYCLPFLKWTTRKNPYTQKKCTWSNLTIFCWMCYVTMVTPQLKTMSLNSKISERLKILLLWADLLSKGDHPDSTLVIFFWY